MTLLLNDSWLFFFEVTLLTDSLVKIAEKKLSRDLTNDEACFQKFVCVV